MRHGRLLPGLALPLGSRRQIHSQTQRSLLPITDEYVFRHLACALSGIRCQPGCWAIVALGIARVLWPGSDRADAENISALVKVKSSA